MSEYDNDDDMLSVEIVPLRGRTEIAYKRNKRTQFTTEELDAVAPLTEVDVKFLAKWSDNPPAYVVGVIEARIQAAKRLKYGGAE